MLQRLLGGTRIVRNLEAATQAWRDTGGAFHYVTLGGDLLSRHGIYTGGYSNENGNGKAPASILGRKNQIAELRMALSKLNEQVAELSRRKGARRLSHPSGIPRGIQGERPGADRARPVIRAASPRRYARQRTVAAAASRYAA